ncbi:uncharacterized protein [Epargyreus clarus]|uniref:uncharacterized protein n=1 Tax=Epargyreus clarus TaxID=520877 RepID=UPI003C30C76B
MAKRLDCVSLQPASTHFDVTVPPRGACSNITPRQQDTEEVKVETICKISPSAPVRSGNSVRSAATSGRTKKSTTSSLTRRKQLELDAAEARAKIQLDLINKRLELELAREAEDGDDRSSECSKQQLEKEVHANVEKWLDESESRTNRPREATIVPEAAAAAPVNAVSYPAFPGNSIEQLAYTLRDMMDNSALQREERLLSRLATPCYLFPVFSGDCIEWLHFKCVYEESARLCRYNDSENLWRLRRALRGDAREAVTDLLIGNTPPAAVMEALELRFGRSDVIIMTITAQLKRLPPLPTNYQQELINFSVKVNNCVATIRALKQEDYLRSPELATAIITKLPSTLIGKWTDFAYNKILDGRSKLEVMAMFLKNEAEMMSVVGLAVPNEERKMREASEKRIIEKRFIKRPVLITAHESDEKCKYCRKSKHILPECRMFKRAMRKERWQFVKNSGMCFCCLLTRHDKNTCTAPVCDIDGCGQPHHTLLHWTKPQSVNGTENDLGAPASSTVAHVTSDNKHTDKIMLKVVSVQLLGPKGVVSVYALLDDAATVSMIDSELADSLGLVDQQASAI